jgi:hypothetical protein
MDASEGSATYEKPSTEDDYQEYEPPSAEEDYECSIVDNERSNLLLSELYNQLLADVRLLHDFGSVCCFPHACKTPKAFLTKETHQSASPHGIQ